MQSKNFMVLTFLYIKFHLEVAHQTFFFKLMVMLPRHIPIVGFSFNYLKILILMSMTKNNLENQNVSKAMNCKTY